MQSWGLWPQAAPKTKVQGPELDACCLCSVSKQGVLPWGTAVLICWSDVCNFWTEEVERLLSAVPVCEDADSPTSRKGKMQKSLPFLSSLLQPGCTHGWDTELIVVTATLGWDHCST